jgi:hypothetical protein
MRHVSRLNGHQYFNARNRCHVVRAKAVLLLLRESKALLDADLKLYHPAEGSEHARVVNDARSSLHSASLDWHKFDLDTIIVDLQDVYTSLQKLSPEGKHRKTP